MSDGYSHNDPYSHQTVTVILIVAFETPILEITCPHKLTSIVRWKRAKRV